MDPKKPPPLIPASKTSGGLGSAPVANNMEQSQNRNNKYNAEVSHMRGSNKLLDLNALVRSVQRSEGEEACFKIGRFDCDESDCRWRDYCLEQGQPNRR